MNTCKRPTVTSGDPLGPNLLDSLHRPAPNISRRSEPPYSTEEYNMQDTTKRFLSAD